MADNKNSMDFDVFRKRERPQTNFLNVNNNHSEQKCLWADEDGEEMSFCFQHLKRVFLSQMPSDKFIIQIYFCVYI